MRPRVLVVDDAPELLDLYELLLERTCTVKTATNAEDAFAIVRDWRPDIVLTDISMPGQSGLELITRVRSDLAPPLPRMGVISGFPGFETAARARGAAVFLLKPVDMETLDSAVAELAGGPVTSVTLRGRAVERRASATQAAELFVARFLAEHPQAADAATRTVTHVARYFGAAAALVLLFRDGELAIFASSDSARFVAGTSANGRLGQAESVIASGATLFISSGGTLAHLGDLPDTDLRLVACAAVRSPEGDPVAGLAILSERACNFDARDLAIVEDMAHHAEHVLARKERPGQAVGDSDLLRHEIWWRLLERELVRLRDGLGLCVSLVEVPTRPPEDEDMSDVFAALGDHAAVAVRHDGQLALFKRAIDPEAAHVAMRRALVELERTSGITRAASLTLADVNPPRSPEAVLEILEGLVAMEAGHGNIVAATLSADIQPVG